MSTPIWLSYLTDLRALFPIDKKLSEEGNKLYLVCDCSPPVHHNDIARVAASDLNIKLILIPKGATDECPPLDRRIFGNMKKKAKLIHQKNAVCKVLESMISGPELGLEKPDNPYACHVFL